MFISSGEKAGKAGTFRKELEITCCSQCWHCSCNKVLANRMFSITVGDCFDWQNKLHSTRLILKFNIRIQNPLIIRRFFTVNWLQLGYSDQPLHNQILLLVKWIQVLQVSLNSKIFHQIHQKISVLEYLWQKYFSQYWETTSKNGNSIFGLWDSYIERYIVTKL